MYYNQNKIKYEGVDCTETFYFLDIPYRETDTYITVDADHVNRLDLIAYEFYGNVQLWYVIAIASEILNPLDVPMGTLLRLPSLVSLYTTNGIGVVR